MSRFVVNADSLAAVERTLGDLGASLHGVSVSASGVGDVLGGGRLPEQLEGFTAEWHRGIEHVAGEVARLSTHLRAAVAAYEAIDGELTHRAQRHRSHPHPHRPGSGSGSTTLGVPVVHRRDRRSASGSGSGTTEISFTAAAPLLRSPGRAR